MTKQNILHHYIIAIKSHDIFSSKVGHVYMKYKPIHWTSKDTNDLYDAIQLSKDNLFPSKISMKEALEINNCNQLIFDLSGLKIAAVANSCSIHHFESQFEMEDEDFDSLVNNYKNNIQLFKNSRISL